MFSVHPYWRSSHKDPILNTVNSIKENIKKQQQIVCDANTAAAMETYIEDLC